MPIPGSLPGSLPGLLAGVLAGVLTLTAGCGDGDDTAGDDPTPSASTSRATESPTEPAATETPSPSGDGSESPAGTVVQVRIEDGQVTPNGERIEVAAGEPVVFEIEADAPGELHAHSNPEHSIEFEAGTSSHEIVIDQPGIVEVELHDPALVVVQLEVR